MRRSRIARFLLLFLPPVVLLFMYGAQTESLPDFGEPPTESAQRIPDGGLLASDFSLDFHLPRKRVRVGDSGGLFIQPAPYEVSLRCLEARTVGFAYTMDGQVWQLDSLRAQILRPQHHVRVADTVTIAQAGPAYWEGQPWLADLHQAWLGGHIELPFADERFREPSQPPETVLVQTRLRPSGPALETLWVSAPRADLSYFPRSGPKPDAQGLKVELSGGCLLESSHGLLLALDRAALHLPAVKRMAQSDSLIVELLRLESQNRVVFGLPQVLGRAEGLQARGALDSLRLAAPVRLVFDTAFVRSAGRARLQAHLDGDSAYLAGSSGRAWSLQSFGDARLFGSPRVGGQGGFDSLWVVFPDLVEAWESDWQLEQLLGAQPYESFGERAPRYFQFGNLRLGLGPRHVPLADTTLPVSADSGALRLRAAHAEMVSGLFDGWDLQAGKLETDTLRVLLSGPGVRAWRARSGEELAAEELRYFFATGELRARGSVHAILADSLLSNSPFGDTTRIRLQADQLEARLRRRAGQLELDSLSARGQPLRVTGMLGEGELLCGSLRYLRNRSLRLGGRLPDGGPPQLELGPHRLQADSLDFDLADMQARLLGHVEAFLSPRAAPLPGLADSLGFSLLRGSADSLWLKLERIYAGSSLRRKLEQALDPGRLFSTATPGALQRALAGSWATRASDVQLFGAPARLELFLAGPGGGDSGGVGASLQPDSLQAQLLRLEGGWLRLDLLRQRYLTTRGPAWEAQPVLQMGLLRLSGDTLELDSGGGRLRALHGVQARIDAGMFGQTRTGPIDFGCESFEATFDTGGLRTVTAVPLPGHKLVFAFAGGRAEVPSLSLADSVLVAGGGVVFRSGRTRLRSDSLLYFIAADSLVVRGNVEAEMLWQSGIWQAQAEQLAVTFRRGRLLAGFTARGDSNPVVLLGPLDAEGRRLRFWGEHIRGQRALLGDSLGAWTVRVSTRATRPGFERPPLTASASDISYSERLGTVELLEEVRISLVHSDGSSSRIDARRGRIELDSARDPSRLWLSEQIVALLSAEQGRLEGEELEVDLVLRSGVLRGNPVRVFVQGLPVLELEEYRIKKLPAWEAP